jgi:choline monooxygenase
MPVFSIDPDIRKAYTLPSDFYTNPRFFEISKERIFSRVWQLVGRVPDLQQLTPVIVLEDLLNEPVILVRDDKSVIALSNVCTHRGKVLVDSPCTANLIRCSYHGRRFDLNGRFLSMPEFESVEGFPSETDNLRKLPTATLGDFVFVSLDSTNSLEDIRAECSTHFRSESERQMEFVSSRDYEVNANWALYCENYLEGFHIPYVHHSLNEVVDYSTYSTETFRYSSVQVGREADGTEAGRYLFIFPNTMFNFYPWGISVNIVNPLAPDKCRVTFLTYVSDRSSLDQGAGADLHRVELEDEAVVESVQRGIRSRFYSRGRYSPTREQGTHHFHRLIAEFMD